MKYIILLLLIISYQSNDKYCFDFIKCFVKPTGVNRWVVHGCDGLYLILTYPYISESKNNNCSKNYRKIKVVNYIIRKPNNNS